MAQQTINIGSAPNDTTGDPLRTAFTKVNANFTDLYTQVAALETDAIIPSQTGNTGKYLTTNGSALNWGAINTLTNGSYSLQLGVDGTLNLPLSTNGKGVIQTPGSYYLDANGAVYGLGSNGTLSLPGNITFPQSKLGVPNVNGTTDAIRLYDFGQEGTQYNYAIGSEGSHIWFNVDQGNSDSLGFKFYGAGTLAAKITTAGNLYINSIKFPDSSYIQSGLWQDVSGNGVGIGSSEGGFESNLGIGSVPGTAYIASAQTSGGSNASSITADAAEARVSIFTSGTSANNYWYFGGDGHLTFPDTTVQTTAFTGTANSLTSTSNITITADTSGTSKSWTFGENIGAFGANVGVIGLPFASGGIYSTTNGVSVYGDYLGKYGINFIYGGSDPITQIVSGTRFDIQTNINNSGFKTFSFGADGTLKFPDTTVQSTAYTGWPVLNTTGDNGPTAIAIGQGSATGSGGIAIGQQAGQNNPGSGGVAIGQQAGSVTQGNNAVAIGGSSGQTLQGANSVAIGNSAGAEDQGAGSIGIGIEAGFSSQGTNSVAIGTGAGETVQGINAVSVGYGSGNNSQGGGAVAVGYQAGNDSQSANSVSIGNSAGKTSQSTQAVAIGVLAGETSQGLGGIAIGASAGTVTQGTYAISIGYDSGTNNQGSGAIAIGYNAGLINQNSYTVAMGAYAGYTSQSAFAVAIGNSAGNNTQGSNAVAVGNNSGNANQGSSAVAIGNNAGVTTQGASSIAIGYNAGYTSQGANSIAIGNGAGQGVTNHQAANTIILNATGSELDGIINQTNSFYVAPIRTDATPSNILYYNTTTNEVTYGSVTSPSSLVNGSYTLSLASNGDLLVPTSQYGTAQIFAATTSTTLFLGNSSHYIQVRGSDGALVFADSSVQTTAYLGTATTSQIGGVKPDGSTITISNGIISAGAVAAGTLTGTTLNSTVVTFASTTTAQTVSIANGVTASGNTNTVNIASAGATGSTTAVTIGSQNGTGTVQINGVTTHSAAVKFNGALQSGGGATNITLTNNGPTLNGTTTAGIIATAQTAGTIASAATIAPTNPITFVSGTTQITTITAPSGIATYGGHIIIIPTGLWTTGTSGNIALATTAVVSRALIMTYDAGTSKWYPSY